MKKWMLIALALLLVMTAAACKKGGKEEKANAQGGTTEQMVETTTEMDEGGPGEEVDGPSDWDLAVDCIGEDVQVLYDTIGFPTKMEYFDSSIEAGEESTIQEGVLYYDGFCVYTLKEGASEIVHNVD